MSVGPLVISLIFYYIQLLGIWPGFLRHRVRLLGHISHKPNDVMVERLLFAHSIPGHSRPMARPHITSMDTAMHDMGSLGHMLQIDLPRDWAKLALYWDVWRGVISRC